MSEQSIQEKPVPAHKCEDHITYRFGVVGWGWYCEICGSFEPIDEVAED